MRPPLQIEPSRSLAWNVQQRVLSRGAVLYQEAALLVREELREPERLMGFVRTVVRRQVAAHIERVVQIRRDQGEMEASAKVADPRGDPERAVPVFIKTSGRGHDVIGGGQSFGGRVSSMAAIEADFGGLVLFSYPLHRPGFPDQLRTEHFARIKCPTLFMSGDRDPFARIDFLKEKIQLIPNSRLEIFKGQGHGLLAVLDQALDVAADFIKQIK